MKNTQDIWKIAVTGLIFVICLVAYSFHDISSNESDTKAPITCTSDAPACGAHDIISDKECPHQGDPCETCPQLDECEKKCAQQVKAAEACPFSKNCTTK